MIGATQRRGAWYDLLARGCAAWLAMLLAAAPAMAAEFVDGIVAVVNEDLVAWSELEQQVLQIKAKAAEGDTRVPPDAVLARQALEQLILQKLQLAEAERLGIQVDDAAIDAAIANIAARNQLTVAQLREVLPSEGLSFEGYREDLRSQILISRLQSREVYNRIQISKSEVDDYLAKQGSAERSAYHILHILLATPEGATSDQIGQVRARAEQLVQELRAGDDFRTAAMAYSDGRQALDGGDLGWMDAGQVPSLFEQQLAEMARGEIRGPIASSSGMHIIKLEDYRGAEREIVRQTEARHILIRTDELTSDTDARTRLEQLRDRIEAGEDFAALARSNSDDRTSALKGGDLGWVSPGDLVPAFEETMDALPIGAISEPFRTQFGWHIVQVQDRRDYDATDEARREAAQIALRNRKASEAVELYLRKLRDQAYVDIRLPGAS
jgi:peptidyl-prolyl cis-trans isomerase SurA